MQDLGFEPNVHCFGNLQETTRFTMPRRQQTMSGGEDTEHCGQLKLFFFSVLFTLSLHIFALIAEV